jgi:hypothetical protein
MDGKDIYHFELSQLCMIVFKRLRASLRVMGAFGGFVDSFPWRASSPIAPTLLVVCLNSLTFPLEAQPFLLIFSKPPISPSITSSCRYKFTQSCSSLARSRNAFPTFWSRRAIFTQPTTGSAGCRISTVPSLWVIETPRKSLAITVSVNVTKWSCPPSSLTLDIHPTRIVFLESSASRAAPLINIRRSSATLFTSSGVVSSSYCLDFKKSSWLPR